MFVYAPVNVNHGPRPLGHSGGCNIPTVLHFDFYPALAGIGTVTIPALRAPVSKARRALFSRGSGGMPPSQKILRLCLLNASQACLFIVFINS